MWQKIATKKHTLSPVNSSLLLLLYTTQPHSNFILPNVVSFLLSLCPINCNPPKTPLTERWKSKLRTICYILLSLYLTSPCTNVIPPISSSRLCNKVGHASVKKKNPSIPVHQIAPTKLDCFATPTNLPNQLTKMEVFSQPLPSLSKLT